MAPNPCARPPILARGPQSVRATPDPCARPPIRARGPQSLRATLNPCARPPIRARDPRSLRAAPNPCARPPILACGPQSVRATPDPCARPPIRARGPQSLRATLNPCARPPILARDPRSLRAAPNPCAWPPILARGPQSVRATPDPCARPPILALVPAAFLAGVWATAYGALLQGVHGRRASLQLHVGASCAACVLRRHSSHSTRLSSFYWPLPLHSPPGGVGPSLSPNVLGTKGAGENFSSSYDGVVMQRPGLGPRARSLGAGRHLVTVPPSGFGGGGLPRVLGARCGGGGGGLARGHGVGWFAFGGAYSPIGLWWWGRGGRCPFVGGRLRMKAW